MAFTLRSLAGANTTGHQLDQSVLVIIDAQQEYVDGTLALPGVRPATANIARLLSAARDAESPIVHVAHVGTPGGPFDPAGPAAIIADVEPADGESVVEKRLPNSFAGTDLRDHLEAHGRGALVIAGFMTHMCVSATARSALDHGYDVTVVSDATSTRDLPDPTGAGIVDAASVHVAALAALADRFAAVVTTDEVLAP